MQAHLQFIAEGVIAREQGLATGSKTVVRDHRRDGREQADGRGDQRLGNARRHGGQPGRTHPPTSATVAPGIAEALIATAIGLFAAIPAVIAYNRFAARSETLISRYYTFADEFQAILHRKVHTSEE